MSAVWIIIFLIACGAALALTWIQKQQNAKWQRIAEILGDVIDVLKRESKKELSQVPIDEVQAVAIAVYRKYISNTPLAALITEDKFAQVIVERWKKLVEIEVMTLRSIAAHTAATGR